MIIGIGTDLIEIERIRRACEREAFLVRCFTSEEIAMIQGEASRAAGNFAVKEAVSKVLGTGFRAFDLKAIEVLRNPQGKPYVRLYGNAALLGNQLGITRLHVSITNTKDYAQAFAVGEGEERQENPWLML